MASMIGVVEGEVRSTYALPHHHKTHIQGFQLTGACRVHRIVAKRSTFPGVEKTQQESKGAPNLGFNQHTGTRPRSVVQKGGYLASLKKACEGGTGHDPCMTSPMMGKPSHSPVQRSSRESHVAGSHNYQRLDHVRADMT